MKKILTAVVIAGCASVFFAALPAQARIAANGLAPMPVNARIALNGLAPMPVNARISFNGRNLNGVSVKGLDLSRIGQKALGK